MQCRWNARLRFSLGFFFSPRGVRGIVSVVASRAKEEEVIRFPGLASKFSAGDFRGPVVRFAVIKGHAPFLSEWLLASILLYGSPLGGSEADAPILVS